MAKAKKDDSSIIPAKVRSEYHVSDVKTAGGRKSIDSNDAVAKELRGLDEDGLRKFAKKEGGDELVQRFNGWLKNNNFGMARMNLGNVVRGIRRNAGKPAKKAAAKKAAPKARAKKTAKVAA